LVRRRSPKATDDERRSPKATDDDLTHRQIWQ
jgi:hypothetical protein